MEILCIPTFQCRHRRSNFKAKHLPDFQERFDMDMWHTWAEIIFNEPGNKLKT